MWPVKTTQWAVPGVAAAVPGVGRVHQVGVLASISFLMLAQEVEAKLASEAARTITGACRALLWLPIAALTSTVTLSSV